MRQQLKYFVFNKKLDYDRSFFYNMEYDEQGFWVKKESAANRGIFLSRVLDSKEEEMEWHRLTLHVSDTEDAPYRISIYTADTNEIFAENKIYKLEELLREENVSLEEKEALFEPYLKRTETGFRDILLHGIKGRYFWMMLEVYQQLDKTLVFQQIQVYFPRQTWLDYLPEVYTAEDNEQFLERYLAIFESMYDDLNAQIKNVPYAMDVMEAEPESLDVLGKWLGLTRSYMCPEKKKRELIKRAVAMYKIRGTRKGILDFMKLYLAEENSDEGDVQVFLVEKSQWHKYRMSEEQKKQYHLLYGESPYVLTVLVNEENIPDRSAYQAFLKVIDTVKPAQCEIQLVVLKPYIFLGGHSYLGVNSMLSKYRPASLTGQAQMPFVQL